MNRPKIKICCIESLEDALFAQRCGADVLGFVSEMPSGPGVIGEDEIARIVAGLPPNVVTFLLTAKVKASEIAEQHRRCKTTALQLCDCVAHEVYDTLREELPGIQLVQVIHITGQGSIAEAKKVAPYVDMLLLDSGNLTKEVKELGGTGRVHDWSTSREIVSAVKVPVFLAGGLNTGNVSRAAHEVQPYGIDVCSGVRTNGRLDRAKLKAFMAAAC